MHLRNLADSDESVLHNPRLQRKPSPDVPNPETLHAIDYSPSELMAMFRKKLSEHSSREEFELAKTFRYFDEFKEGIIGKPEFKKVCQWFNFITSGTDFDTLYKFVSDETDGKVYWSELSTKVFPPDTPGYKGGTIDKDFFSRNFNHADNTYMDDFNNNVHNERDEPDDSMFPPLFSPCPGTRQLSSTSTGRKGGGRGGRAVFTPRFRPGSSATGTSTESSTSQLRKIDGCGGMQKIRRNLETISEDATKENTKPADHQAAAPSKAHPKPACIVTAPQHRSSNIILHPSPSIATHKAK